MMLNLPEGSFLYPRLTTNSRSNLLLLNRGKAGLEASVQGTEYDMPTDQRCLFVSCAAADLERVATLVDAVREEFSLRNLPVDVSMDISNLRAVSVFEENQERSQFRGRCSRP
jgi:hypothetical protein